MSDKLKFKILCLASWYPNRVNPAWGTFIKRHIEAISLYCDVSVLSAIHDPNLKDKKYEIQSTLENGIPVTRVYFRQNIKIPKIRQIFYLFRYIMANYIGLQVMRKQFGRPDIVHVNVILFAGLIGLFLKYIKKIPYIVTEHWSGYIPESAKYRILFEKFIARLIVKNAQCITTVSRFLKDIMLNHGLKNNYYIVPNVVKFCNTTATIRGNKSDKKQIIHVSFLDDKIKNVSDILRVLKKVYRIRTDFELHILGDGCDRTILENLAKELGLLNECVFFHGMKTHDEICAFYSISDFFVLNSNFETFSVVSAEAISCGLPVIVTKSKGPEEFITQDFGILIEPGNPSQLEDAILNMLDNHQKYDKNKMQEFARNEFSYEVVGGEFLKIYTEICPNIGTRTVYDNTEFWISVHKRMNKTLKSVGRRQLSEKFNELKYSSETRSFLKIFEQIRKSLSTKKVRVLDAGAGIGYWSNLLYNNLIENGYDIEVTALDISEEAVKFLNSTFPHFTAINADLKSISKSKYENRYDIVISFYCLYHIIDIDGFLNALEFCAKSVKQQGYLILMDNILNKSFNRINTIEFPDYRGNGIPRPLHYYDNVLCNRGFERKTLIGAISSILNDNIEAKSWFDYKCFRLVWKVLEKFYRYEFSTKLISPLVMALDSIFKKIYSNTTKIVVYRKNR